MRLEKERNPALGRIEDHEASQGLLAGKVRLGRETGRVPEKLLS